MAVALVVLAGCEEVPPCEELGESECREQHECMWSSVTRYRMNDGACEVVRSGEGCYDRTWVTAGCSSLECGEGPAPWYRVDADGSVALADVDTCGAGVAGWGACQQLEDGTEPPICACACE